MAMDFVTANEAAGAPYFLEVALYAPHNRTSPEGHYAGDPLFPPMFRDRAGERSCGRVACGKLTVDDLPGFGDRRKDNRPRLANGKRARAWNTAPHPARRGRRPRPARPRADGSVGRPAGAADPLLRRPEHLRRAHLRQRLPPRPERHGPRQGDAVRHRRARPAPRHRAGRRARHAQGGHQQHRPRPDLRGARRARARALPQRPLARPDPGQTRSWCGSPTPSSSTPSRRSTGNDPDAAFSGSELDRIPSFTAVRSRTALLARFDLDPGPGKVTSWGYEYYSYKRDTFEKRNTFANPKRAAEVAALMAKLDRLRRLPGGRRPAGVGGLPRRTAVAAAGTSVAACTPDVIVVDHHDSYTWNLVHLVARVTGVLPRVVQHDEVSRRGGARGTRTSCCRRVPATRSSPTDFAVGPARCCGPAPAPCSASAWACRDW